MYKISFIPIIILLCCSRIFSQSNLEKVKSLRINQSEDTITVYYSNGYYLRAVQTKNLLKKSSDYFENKFGVKETFSIAVLDSGDWNKITEIPYGLPFVSGPPYIVCIPASSDNELGKIIKESISGYNLNERYSIENDEIINLFISLIGFHELGHIYSKAYGLKFPNKWTFEFAATYFAYRFLFDDNPSDCQIWEKVAEILIEEIKPIHTSLSDFEKLYVRVGVENYAWYQAVFLLRAAEVNAENGHEFIKELLKVNLTNSSNYYSLDILEKINPGFLAWAQMFKLIE